MCGTGIEDHRFDNRPPSNNGVAKGGRGASAQQTVVTMRTRTLAGVLQTASAPRVIDYMSLDVEGAESAVLSSGFDWDKYTFLTLSIERPSPDLNARLFSHGYLFVRNIGNVDTFYVHRTHPHAFGRGGVSANHTFVQVPAKCRNHGTRYAERARLRGVPCASIFGCCEFPGYPQETTRYTLGRAGGRRLAAASSDSVSE